MQSNNPLTKQSYPGLSIRQLNRALLQRQMLLNRRHISVLDALEHLVGLQAQAPNPPYFALWTRLEQFTQADLAHLITDRQAVRIALMRSTIHLVTARDCLSLRLLLQPVLDRGLKGSFGKQLTGIDQESLAAAGRSLVEQQPRTFKEIGDLLAADEQWHRHNPAAIAAAIRTYVPLVQVPPRGLWGESGQAVHTSAEAWLGSPLSQQGTLEQMIERYLAAFGPASIKDMQAWCGLTRLNEAVMGMRSRLRTFQDEQGRELFDLPDAPIPDPDTPARPRFLGEFDNMLLSYDVRTRIIADEYRSRIFTPNGLIPATILIDGFVCGTWKIVRNRQEATLTIEPFKPLTKEDQTALSEEGARLLQFAAADCSNHEIQIL